MSDRESRIRAERALNIVESAADAIISEDLGGVIQSWNGGAERTFGYRASEVVGRPITVLLPPERRAEEADILASVKRGERIEHYETVRLTKSGRRVDVSLTISPLRDAAGTVIGASKIVRDVSDRRRLDDARARLAAIVESSDDAIVSKDAQGNIQS